MMPINGKTKIYGIIGHPIEHTLSPAMQNAAFMALGINGVYVPFEVKPDDLGKSIKSFLLTGVCGFNVTVPHKISCMKFLDKIDDSAKAIGAVNTVKIVNKKLFGFNTDGIGFLRSLKEDLKIDPKNKNIFVIGSGGASRAVVWTLAKAGAKSIVVVDKINQKALELASTCSFAGDVKSIDCGDNWASCVSGADILINASPIGMKDTDLSPIDIKLLHKRLVIFDLIYNKHTKLVKNAKAKGLKACGGFGMLLYQGVEAFEIWTGQKPPVAIMRNALISQFSLRGPRNVRWWA